MKQSTLQYRQKFFRNSFFLVIFGIGKMQRHNASTNFKMSDMIYVYAQVDYNGPSVSRKIFRTATESQAVRTYMFFGN